jgi:TRAP-type C4-dicarboxylate transport system permease small subunit
MRSFLAVWKRFAESVSVVAFALMFAGFVIGVGGRYLFNTPIAWSNEICAIGFVWIVFWTSDILLKERQHIVFDVIYNAFPPRVRRVVALFITLSLALLFLAVLPGTLDYTLFLRTRYSMILRVPMQLVFGCFLVFVIAVAVNSILRIWQLLRPGWEKHL